MTVTSGVIVLDWTAQLIDTYGSYPLIWAYFNGQWQNITAQLDNTDNPTQITIDIGTIPATDLSLIIKKPDTVTQYTPAFLTGTGGIITEAVTELKGYWIYFDGQTQPITPVFDNIDAPTTVTIDLGTIPATNAYLAAKTPDADLVFTHAEMVTSGGIITIAADINLYGQYPRFYAVYDGQYQLTTPVVTPSLFTIDLGTIPAGNTHILIVSGGYAVAITDLIGATSEPISIPCIQGDPRDKMQPLKGSNSTTRVIAGADYGIDIADIYTDDETEFYEEINIEQPDDTFLVSWSNFDSPDSVKVESFMQIYRNDTLIVQSFLSESGSFRVTRGDTVTAVAYSVAAWPTPQCGLELAFSGLPTLRTVVNGSAITYDHIPVLYDISINAYSTYSASLYRAIRSEVFYNQTSGFPATFTKAYTGVDQATADATALADPLFYTEGQAYANTYPQGWPAFWRGFLVIDAGTQQPFQTPSILELSFVDGIGLLKNLLFADNGGNYFTGKSTPKDIIYNCLYRLGVPDMNFYIHSEIYESSMDELDDSMTQVLHQLETYYLSTQTKPLDMGAVMEAVLRVYGLEIRQNLGEWWITEIDTLFVSGEKTWFKYSGVTGELLQEYPWNPRRTLGCVSGTFDNIFARADQMKIFDRAYRGQILNYAFKAATQIIENPNLVWDTSGIPFLPGWTAAGSPVPQQGPDAHGAQLISTGNQLAPPSAVTLTSDPIAVQPGDLIQFGFNFSNTGSATFCKVQVIFDNLSGGLYYLDLNGGWNLASGQFMYVGNWQILQGMIGDYQYAKNSDLTFNVPPISDSGSPVIPIVPIPGVLAGELTVKLYNYDFSQDDNINDPTYPALTGYVQYNLVSVAFGTSPGDSGVAAGTFYIAANVGNATFTPPILQVLNADDDTAKYVGTLYQEDAATPTRSWHRSDDPYDIKPLLWIIAEMYVRMYQSPFYIMQGTIYGIFPQLSSWDVEGFPGAYILVGADYQLGSMLQNSNLIQISSEGIFGAPATIEETDYGQYSDGDLPVIIPG